MLVFVSVWELAIRIEAGLVLFIVKDTNQSRNTHRIVFCSILLCDLRRAVGGEQ